MRADFTGDFGVIDHQLDKALTAQAGRRLDQRHPNGLPAGLGDGMEAKRAAALAL